VEKQLQSAIYPEKEFSKSSKLALSDPGAAGPGPGRDFKVAATPRTNTSIVGIGIEVGVVYSA
jgi:hypothetical protein